MINKVEIMYYYAKNVNILHFLKEKTFQISSILI